MAIEASAPMLASRPDHISRLTMSLSVIAAAVYEAVAACASSPSQIVSTTKCFARS